MLHITCALKPEARPLLDYFKLRPASAGAGIHHNSDSGISLTVSGIGKSAAAAAVARTREHFKAGRSHAWLNLGIAGHASLPVGQAVLVKKITDDASGQTWFPSRVFTSTLPAHDLLTLDNPGSNYRNELFDMECAGFFRAASKHATLELVQSLKIISDNCDQPMEGINPALISRLIGQNLPVIEEVVEQLLAPAQLLQRLNDPGPGLPLAPPAQALYRQPATPTAVLTQKMADVASGRGKTGRAPDRNENRRRGPLAPAG